MGAGGGGDVFCDHDAADVVAAEPETELAGLETLSDPGALDVLNVVEVDAGDGEGLEVLDGGRFLFDKAAKRGVLALEGPRDEGGEAAGLLLEIADELEVVHPLLDGLAAAEHHGGGRPHAELMRGTVDVDPLVNRALQTADAMADSVVEDLRAAAGDGVETGVAEAGDGVPQAD